MRASCPEPGQRIACPGSIGSPERPDKPAECAGDAEVSVRPAVERGQRHGGDVGVTAADFDREALQRDDPFVGGAGRFGSIQGNFAGVDGVYVDPAGRPGQGHLGGRGGPWNGRLELVDRLVSLADSPSLERRLELERGREFRVSARGVGRHGRDLGSRRAIAGHSAQVTEHRRHDGVGRVPLCELRQAPARHRDVTGRQGPRGGHEGQSSREVGVLLQRRELVHGGERPTPGGRRGRPLVFDLGLRRVRGRKRLQHPPEPGPLRRRRHLAQRSSLALHVAPRTTKAYELHVKGDDLAFVRAGREQALDGLFVPGRILDDARECPRDARGGGGGDTVHPGLRESSLRSADIFGLYRPDVRREEEGLAARLVCRELVGERFELRRERGRVLAVREDVELQGSGGEAPWVGGEGSRECLERPRSVPLRCRVLGDPHGEGRRQRTILLGRQAILRQPRRERRVAGLLGDANPRRHHRAFREMIRALPGAPKMGEGLVERRPRAIELPETPSCIGGAEPRVDEPRRLSGPARHPEFVPGGFVEGRALDDRRGFVEGGGVGLGASVPAGSDLCARGFASDLLDECRRAKCGRRTERPRLFEQRERDLDLPRRGRHPRAVHEQKRSPQRLRRVLRSLGQRGLAHRGVARPPGEDLQREPCARLFGDRGARDRGRLDGASLGLDQIARDVRLVGGAHHESAHLLVRSGGRSHHRVDELAEVLQAATLLEQPHQALEGLAKRGVRVVCGQVVARRTRLVARALLEIGDRHEQPCLPSPVAGRGQLRSNAPYRLLGGQRRLGGGGGREARGSRRRKVRRLVDRGRMGHARGRRRTTA